MVTTTDTDSEDQRGALSPLRIHLHFITDRCVATKVDSREEAEWPPHPGRLFMALAAAYFETTANDEEKQAERAALDWLSAQPAPRIYDCYLGPDDSKLKLRVRSAVTYFVPVNDAGQPNKAMLQSAPGMPRSRQPRFFPTVIMPRSNNGTNDLAPDVTYEWSNSDEASQHLPALDRLCQNVIRVGHSSSLVMAWLDTDSADYPEQYWEPDSSESTLTCRIAGVGELDRLQSACRADEIELFANLKQEIESTKGKEQKAAKERFADVFGEPYKNSSRPPESTPPVLGLWQGYRRIMQNKQIQVDHKPYFEQDLLILAKHEGPNLAIERTLNLTQALRSAVLAAHGDAEIPEWLSGHAPDNSPSEQPHAAFLALPFIGSPYADGHIMGMAIALPKGISVSERGRWLGPFLVDQQTGQPKERIWKLWGKDLPDCEWKLVLDQSLSPPVTLKNETWTKQSTEWTSATPVVLDRFPKSSRMDDREGWLEEVADIIRLSLQRAGLPDPQEVGVNSTAWLTGVPRAWGKRRPLRGRSNSDQTAPLGDGFPWMQSKASRPSKPQVHVHLKFQQAVEGPVLIGAGRYAGYGLCKPIDEKKS